MVKLVVDCYGGDRGPSVNVEAAVKAVNENNDLKIVLSGKEDELKELLANYKYNIDQIEILNAIDVISCEDIPTVAIKRKTESSMVKAFDMLKNDPECGGMVSTGSTGALLTGAVLKIGRIKGIKRPAFCPLMPTIPGGFVAVCDSGANVDCDPLWLEQFAMMGNLYLQKAYNNMNARIALLNIGTEEEKGDMLRKETYQLLKNNVSLNFVGNMESRDLLSGEYDLVVCDGFAGNVLLKSTEGACLELLGLLKKAFYKNAKTKIGALLLKDEMMNIKEMMDYNNYPGAVLLGCNKTMVKSHGSSKASAIYESIKLCYKLKVSGLTDAIKDSIVIPEVEE